MESDGAQGHTGVPGRKGIMNVSRKDNIGVEGLVSIITPAYNAAAFLAETVDSVQAQTYRQWEWVIVDDGSTDDTVGIIEKAAQGDPRIRLISLKGASGLAARARNRAMRAAAGEFIAFLDADDLWEPEKLERQVSYLREISAADGVCCRHDFFGDETRVRREKKMRNFKLEAQRVCHRSDFIKELPFQTSTVLLRRQCYDILGGMDEDSRLRSGQDVEFFARVVASFEIHRIPKVLSHYRLTPLTNSLNLSNLNVKNRAAWNVFEVMREKGFYSPAEARRKRSSLYYDQAINNLFFLNAPYRRCLLRSILSGSPPLRAVIVFSLCFLGRKQLKRTLTWSLSLANRYYLREEKRS